MLDELCRDEVERFVPRRRFELAVAPDQRPGQPVGVMHERRAEAAFHAEHALARRVRRLVEHADDPVARVDLQCDAASDAAIRTRARDLPRDGRGRRRLRQNRPGRTHRHALPARRADRVGDRLVRKRRDSRVAPAARDRDRADVLHVLAGVHAAPAEDTRAQICIEEGAAGVAIFARVRRVAVAPHVISLQFAVQLARHALPRRDGAAVDHRHRHLQHGAPHAVERLAGRRYGHAGRGGRVAARPQPAHALDGDEARAARADRRLVLVFAEMWHVASGRQHRVEHAAAVGDVDARAVDRQRYRHGASPCISAAKWRRALR